MKDDGSASPFLRVHLARGQPVLVHLARGVSEVPLVHARVTHPEPAVLSTPAPPACEHVQEHVLIDVVVTLAQSFGAVLVGGSETIVRLAAQPHEPVTGSLHLEQTRCSLIVRLARLTARLGDSPRATGESTAHVLVLMFGATFGREPFGALPEVMFS